MLGALASLWLLANAPAQTTTLPRHPDPDPAENRAQREGESTDPLFNRAQRATDDPAFVLAAVENTRQGVIDARGAERALASAELRALAEKIRVQNQSTTGKLEALAESKGWRLPAPNPARIPNVDNGSSQPAADAAARANANFILNQISFHENTLSQFRAQLAGKGDAELKRTLRAAVPGYQKNLEALLTAKP